MPEQDRKSKELHAVQLLWVHLLPLKWVLDTGTKWALLAQFLKVQRPSKQRRNHSWGWPSKGWGAWEHSHALRVPFCIVHVYMQCFNLLGSCDLPRKQDSLQGHLFFWNNRTISQSNFEIPLKCSLPSLPAMIYSFFFQGVGQKLNPAPKKGDISSSPYCCTGSWNLASASHWWYLWN